MTLLRVTNLNKAFGNLVVTRDVCLDLHPGERHVIIGPNGAGKTSLIHQLGGQLLPDSGTVQIGEINATNLAPERRAQLGLARTFQKNTLFQGLSAFENARLGAQARFGSIYDMTRRARGRRDINERAMDALSRLSLAKHAGRLVSNLSYGDQRQLEVAVALAGSPSILLLDEPTSGLSPAETGQLIELIKGLPSELGIIMIEHDMEVVFSIAHRITVLYYGEVLASGTPADVASNARVKEVYLGATSNHA